MYGPGKQVYCLELKLREVKLDLHSSTFEDESIGLPFGREDLSVQIPLLHMAQLTH